MSPRIIAFLPVLTAALLLSACGGGSSAPANSTSSGGSAAGAVTDSTDGSIVTGTPGEPSAASPNSIPRVIYRADYPVNGQFQLYSTALSGNENPARLNAAMASLNSNIESFAISPSMHHVAYLADQDDNGVVELFVASIDGSTSLKINNPLPTYGEVSAFQWSVDGSHIGYLVEQETDKSFDLYIATPDGSSKANLSMVASGGTVETFSFSPDGSHLAFIARMSVSDSRKLYSVQADGENLKTVNGQLHDNGFVNSFEWAPDSQLIAYKAYQDLPTISELYISNRDGSGNRKVSGEMDEDAFTGVNYFHWSADSSKVAYVADHLGDTQQLYTTDTHADGAMLINTPLDQHERISSFAWAPDSQSIAYHTYSSYFGSLRKLLVNEANGGSELPLSEPYSDTISVMQWTNDSANLIYLADSELYISASNGLNTRRLNKDLVDNGEVWSYRLSSDQSSVLYTASQDSPDSVELYIATLDDTLNQKLNNTLSSWFTQINRFAWSDDDQHIVFSAAQTDQGTGVYRVSFDDLNTTINISGDLGTGSMAGSFALTGSDELVER